jgi:hypothetical protein
VSNFESQASVRILFAKFERDFDLILID